MFVLEQDYIRVRLQLTSLRYVVIWFIYFFQVDFFWINRDQRSFEWFVNLLSQLEIEQAEQGGAMERFLDMHMYITSALQKTDMKAVGLQLALDLLHKKVLYCYYKFILTNYSMKTQSGRAPRFFNLGFELPNFQNFDTPTK